MGQVGSFVAPQAHITYDQKQVSLYADICQKNDEKITLRLCIRTGRDPIYQKKAEGTITRGIANPDERNLRPCSK